MYRRQPERTKSTELSKITHSNILNEVCVFVCVASPQQQSEETRPEIRLLSRRDDRDKPSFARLSPPPLITERERDPDRQCPRRLPPSLRNRSPTMTLARQTHIHTSGFMIATVVPRVLGCWTHSGCLV